MSEIENNPLAIATRAVMAHYGYTPEQVAEAETLTHEQAGCEFEYPRWNCFDEDGESLHPVMDELDGTAEILQVAFDAIGVEA